MPRSGIVYADWCTPSMGANSWGSSPLQEVSVHELLAKDKVAAARPRLKEVWSKPASPRTGTPYKAQPEDEQAQHERSPTDLGQGKWRGCAGEVCAPYLGRPARHRLSQALAHGSARRAETPAGLRAGVSRGRGSVESRESGRSEGPNGRTVWERWPQRERRSRRAEPTDVWRPEPPCRKRPS